MGFPYSNRSVLLIFQSFSMIDWNPAPTPFQSCGVLSTTFSTPIVDSTLYRQLVGSLLYLTYRRPDLSFVVGLVSLFSHDAHESHWQAAKHILRYIWGTTCYDIHYTSGDPHIVGYTDSYWASDIDDQKSTSVFIFFLGSGPITWSCKKQHAHILSSIEA